MHLSKYLVSILVMLISVSSQAEAAKGLPYFVETESLAAPGFEGPKTYVLLPASEELRRDDLQYQYVLPYFVAALHARQLVPAAQNSQPDLVIYVDFGVGNPVSDTRVRSFPIFGQTGVSGSVTTGAVYGNTFSATTTFIPTFGVTGHSNTVEKFTTYTKRISIEGYYASGLNEKGEPRPAFRTNIYEFGESPDLRRAFPPMLAAAIPHIGKTTTGNVRLGVRENHRIVKSFKKTVAGLPQRP